MAVICFHYIEGSTTASAATTTIRPLNEAARGARVRIVPFCFYIKIFALHTHTQRYEHYTCASIQGDCVYRSSFKLIYTRGKRFKKIKSKKVNCFSPLTFIFIYYFSYNYIRSISIISILDLY